eukprot:CAMPEP_0194211040 /NCGR_PEP_ID=MMETSP0156-20130528/9250_1 /TAXON_ID=33649 /ORGANISM="Thalassionema nitzschioides, Strain L26-B" /LENGTH=570 /DNA_ID=CAMNT_0038938465 /DNA_START=28 /DNA_END=1740 /DNA_ORIENTATION=+
MALVPTTAPLPIDCSLYQHTVALGENKNFEMDYVVIDDDDSDDNKLYLKAQLRYTKQAWLSIGMSSSKYFMVPGDAIVGLPNSKQVLKYDMTTSALDGSGVTVKSAAQQTLFDTSVEQNSTMTVMQFTKALEEEGDLTIDGYGTNFFLWAYGTSNDFIYHEKAGLVALNLQPCTSDGSGSEVDPVVPMDGNIPQPVDLQSYYASHGWLAALAWGVFTPVAIGASLVKPLFPFLQKNGLWYKIHFYANCMTLLLTTISFGVAVAAQELKLRPEGTSANHFSEVAHASIGLAIMIVLCVQVLGGIWRPDKVDMTKQVGDNQETRRKRQQKRSRSGWELSHRFLGLGMIGLCWYQCHTGLELYELLSQSTTDYIALFWGITGTLGGLILVGTVLGTFKKKETTTTTTNAKTTKDGDDDIENNDNTMNNNNSTVNGNGYTRGETMEAMTNEFDNSREVSQTRSCDDDDAPPDDTQDNSHNDENVIELNESCEVDLVGEVAVTTSSISEEAPSMSVDDEKKNNDAETTTISSSSKSNTEEGNDATPHNESSTDEQHLPAQDNLEEENKLSSDGAD